ncbi:MAG: proline iminopeptidase-family hydrolase [Meiothermus sp.]|nr:proline iminopeptidase-family hydrolase [Meiothermus sp.]
MEMKTQKVKVPGGEVATYSFGEGPLTVMVVSGGPGVSCDYLRESHSQYATEGFRLVAWDQLGTGQSDRPTDPALWEIPRFVEEMEAVRSALGLGRVHVIGHSWGGVLGLEYALAYPQYLGRFVMANISVNVPLMNQGFKQCKLALGLETAKMIALRESEGTTSHPEYQAAATLLTYRHICRTEILPEPVAKSLGEIGPAYPKMFGPFLMHCTGSLATWDRTADLHRVASPVLIVSGEHDYILPEYAGISLNYLPNARMKIFRGCAHMPFWEDPAAYHRAVLEFLRA